MSGWDNLLGIVKEFRELAEQDRARPKVECAVDGEPLWQGPEGELYCPFCGRRY